jgi:5-methyltetrahydrofolate--homocysteine methyltransferase
MGDILERLAHAVEVGKANARAAFPPELKGQPGADELCRDALAAGHSAGEILDRALIVGMTRIGAKFGEGAAFVPDMLMSARAMSTAMGHLRPFFASGQVKAKGIFVVGTVAGDLHDIGKNIVAMMIEGAGWQVVDLGVDVKSERVLEAIEQHPGCVVGLSALLTTTMVAMEKTVREIRARHPTNVILVGGAPVTREFCERIGANHYSPDPQGAVEYLKSISIAA